MRKIWQAVTFAGMVCIVSCQTLPGQPASSETAKPERQLTTSDLSGLGGKNWAGTLTYLDYTSGNRTVLDVRANVLVKLDCLVLSLDYPDEPQANSTDEMCISENGTKFVGAPLFSLQRLGPDFIAFQTETTGEDDSRPALIRQHYILSQNAITSGKEVSFDGGETWVERNELDVER